MALHDKIHVPVGLIDSAVGGTVVEAWTPKPELDACAAGPDLEKRYAERLEKLPAAEKAKYAAALAEWTTKHPTPQLQQENLLTRPMLDAGRPNYPARLYNGMIHGLEPYTLKGVIWFQGDGNCPHPQDYGILIKTMIAALGVPIFTTQRRCRSITSRCRIMASRRSSPSSPTPFPTSASSSRPRSNSRPPMTPPASIRALPFRIMRLISPTRSSWLPVAALPALALDHLYGQPGLVHSPRFKSFKIEGNKIRLQFEYADGLRLRGHAELAGFAIRAADGEWVWAKGQIDGQDIVVWSDQIAKPVQVRYAWAWHPILSVENSAGLPLRPFRTDVGSERYRVDAVRKRHCRGRVFLPLAGFANRELVHRQCCWRTAVDS